MIKKLHHWCQEKVHSGIGHDWPGCAELTEHTVGAPRGPAGFENCPERVSEATDRKLKTDN